MTNKIYEKYERLSSIIPTLVEFNILPEACDWQDMEDLKNKWGIVNEEEEYENFLNQIPLEEYEFFMEDYRNMVEKIIQDYYGRSKSAGWL